MFILFLRYITHYPQIPTGIDHKSRGRQRPSYFRINRLLWELDIQVEHMSILVVTK